jgi:histidyl-tRNA synthetase
VTDQLGAQGTVLAGGRYDGLIEQLGGPHTPAVGWAAGIERLAMLIDHPGVEISDVVVIPMSSASDQKGRELLAKLRNYMIHADMAFRGNLKKRLQKASSAGARFAVLIGDDELARGEAGVKNLQTGDQVNVPFAEIPTYFSKLLHPIWNVPPGDFDFVGNERDE